MADFLSPEQRSERMSRIRSKNTSPEVKLRRTLHALGLRFRLHDRRLPGRPDIVLPRFKTVVLVNGCFWHRHANCKVASTPKSNASFWQEKFERNVARDKRNAAALALLGWRVIVAWECDLGTQLRAEELATKISRQIGHQPSRA